MTAEEYAYEIALISATVAAYVLKTARLFLGPRLTVAQWISLLQVIYPEVYQQRLRAAEIARDFYDSERSRVHPDLPRHEQFLVEYDFEEFVSDMNPVREKMSREEAGDSDAGALALRAVRSVELGGRKQIIRAVQDDPLEVIEPEPDPIQTAVEATVSRSRERRQFRDLLKEFQPDTPAPQPVSRGIDRDEIRDARERGQSIKGWARVATGNETCAWCLMLISRGPVYVGAESAGLDLDDDTAARMIAGGEDVRPFMEEWHTGCDCKVVPVFDIGSWSGFNAWKRAESLWEDASLEARALIESGEARSDNLNKETVNALRRRLERGDVSMTDFAVAA
ncbi:head maturation protease [Mycobacterium phage DroogsArmy]|uniref:Capsid maturation protease n=2 Tax=Timshelvirus TaxID=2948926 RepID=G1DB32_9CAUD|nr:head maturation protease [Mycobacterium phage Timshel]YP_010061968.1 head maturation protease [Mycobacterium phage DroogsArmy]AEJ92328.1 capsid maturation protease [Mycobacterium phage Timshel]QKO02410.1 capsid maturation protease [Mycobacterium phage DroogsArmy]